MKDICRLFAYLMGSTTLLIGFMGTLNIIFDQNWGLRSGTSVSPLPKDPGELLFLVGFFFIFAGFLYLCGSIGDAIKLIRKHAPASLGILALLAFLLVIGGNYGFTLFMGGPVQRAVEMGNTAKVEELMQRNTYEAAALRKPLYFALKQSDYRMAEALINAGADVNYTNEDEFTPLLTSSVFHFELAAIRFLLENEADPNLQDDLGRTAMVVAVLYRDEEEVLPVLDMLQAAGGDFSIAADNGDTASAIATSKNNKSVIDFLREI
ncbi:MAG: ankyrin repeat domain-containing protein [Cyanobacteria bacterium J06643_4]